jgi:hypothetical protein
MRALSMRFARPSWCDSSVIAGWSRYSSIAASCSSLSLAPARSKNLMPLSSYGVVRRADDHPDVGAELLREVGDARRGQRAEEQDVGPCRDEAGFQRGLEHVPGQARVLADEHRSAVRREDARGRAGEAQREFRAHGILPDAPPDAVGAEIVLAHAAGAAWPDRNSFFMAP